jgi:hypothetical protein
MKACYSTEQTYVNCTGQMTQAKTGIPDADFKVTAGPATDQFKVVATSRGGNTFTVEQAASTGVMSYSCATLGTGGCPTTSPGDWSK